MIKKNHSISFLGCGMWVTYKTDGKIRRQILNLDDSCKKIIGFLGLSENCFAWNGDSKAPDS